MKQHFEKSIFGKIASAPTDPKLTLNAARPKVPLYVKITGCESQISLRFAVLSLLFQIIVVFDFFIAYRVQWRI